MVVFSIHRNPPIGFGERIVLAELSKLPSFQSLGAYDEISGLSILWSEK